MLTFFLKQAVAPDHPARGLLGSFKGAGFS
jgi:hypothetical protein